MKEGATKALCSDGSSGHVGVDGPTGAGENHRKTPEQWTECGLLQLMARPAKHIR